MEQNSLKQIATLLRQPLLTRVCLAVLPFGLMVGGSQAQAMPTRYPITTDQVIAAMTARHLPTEAVQIKLSAPITSSSSNPSLEIEAVTRVSELGAQFRLSCTTKHDCLPFLASATWARASVEISTALSQATSAGSRRGALTESGKSGAAASDSPVMRSGTQATLLIEDQKIHIRMRVVCLEDGTTGAKIRVATPDRRQSYRAEVLAPKLLRGSF